MMTWQEFIEKVKEAKVKEDTKIGSIDLSSTYTDVKELDIEITKDNILYVTQRI